MSKEIENYTGFRAVFRNIFGRSSKVKNTREDEIAINKEETLNLEHERILEFIKKWEEENKFESLEESNSKFKEDYGSFIETGGFSYEVVQEHRDGLERDKALKDSMSESDRILDFIKSFREANEGLELEEKNKRFTKAFKKFLLEGDFSQETLSNHHSVVKG
ncbi:hypothetical protein [Wenyingzhuangia sp. IMCC45574]